MPEDKIISTLNSLSDWLQESRLLRDFTPLDDFVLSQML